jgi:predicted O-methyltransferase YrrM
LPTTTQKAASSGIQPEPISVEATLPQLARDWNVSLEQLQRHYRDLQDSTEFLSAINHAIRHVPEFSGVQFTHVSELRVYRCLLYLFTRTFRPEVFVETGVLNGFGSAFILLGMLHNDVGTLISIDLPPVDERILAQGTGALPQTKNPGWAIPDNLRSRHQLALGDARTLLPQILEHHQPLDAFLHDSDHSYEHMMFEMSLAWSYLRPGGWLLCDNVEANDSFSDFVSGVGATSLIAASFDCPERTWQHGMARKNAPDQHG